MSKDKRLYFATIRENTPKHLLVSEEDACSCAVWCLIANNRELADDVDGIYQQLKAEERGLTACQGEGVRE